MTLISATHIGPAQVVWMLTILVTFANAARWDRPKVAWVWLFLTFVVWWGGFFAVRS